MLYWSKDPGSERSGSGAAVSARGFVSSQDQFQRVPALMSIHERPATLADRGREIVHNPAMTLKVDGHGVG